MLKTINYKKIQILLAIIIALFSALIVEVVCIFVVFNFDSLYHGFNFARFFFFCGVSLTLSIIYFIYKGYIKRVESIFLVLSLIIGSVMILSSPFGHTCWDLESHFKSILSFVTFDGQITEAEDIFSDPNADSSFRHNYNDNAEFIQDINNKDFCTVEKGFNFYLVSHIPGAIVYGAAKLLNLPFNIRLDLVKFCYLFLYSIICYFAIKKLKTSKLIFATIGLMPTCLFIASNITYDWWIISFCMLGIAYFYSEYQQPSKKMKIYEVLIMMGSLFLGCYIKSVYFLLLFVPLFMKKDYFKLEKKEKIKYYSIVFIFILLLFLTFVSSIFAISDQGDSRGGNNVNPAAQIFFIFSNPIEYTFILVNFFTQFMSVAYLINLTSSFAHLTTGANLVVARDFGIFIIILAVVTAVDRNRFDKLTATWKFKIIASIVFFITTILIITALYVDFNNVGSLTISGVQARYLIPLLPMLLPTLGFVNLKHKLSWPTTNIKIGFVSILSIFIFWDIGHVMLLQLL